MNQESERIRAALTYIISENEPSDKDTFLLSDGDVVEFSENYIINNKNLPNLFRYTKADYFPILDLEENSIRLSDIGNMNDVFELFSGKTKKGTCFGDERNVLEELRYATRLLKIKSFSENSNDLLMWAIYAENYSGICVEYDFTLAEKHLLYHLFPIVYRSNRLPYSFLNSAISAFNCYYNDNDDDDVESMDHMTAIGLVKSLSWEYEKEWRLIFNYRHIKEKYEYAQSNYDNPQLYYYDDFTINLPKPIAVYLGPRINSTKRKHICKICKKQNLSVYDMELSNDEFKLEKHIIDLSNIKE